MLIERRYTKAGEDAYKAIGFRRATSEIRNPDGSVVFRLEDIEVPASWSQVAADICPGTRLSPVRIPPDRVLFDPIV